MIYNISLVVTIILSLMLLNDLRRKLPFRVYCIDTFMLVLSVIVLLSNK